MDGITRQQYTVRILEHALSVVQGQPGVPARAPRSARYDASEVGIRAGLERAYRALARDAPDLEARVDLVNQANAVRTWTLT